MPLLRELIGGGGGGQAPQPKHWGVAPLSYSYVCFLGADAS